MVKDTDECEWYFLTFLIDLFPGLMIIFALAKFYDNTFERCRCKKLVSGNYIRDVGGIAIVSYPVYWIQVFLWLSISLITKFSLIFIERVFLKPLSIFAKLALKIFQWSADLKLFFVLIIFPLFVNTFIFWISDSLLKKKKWDPEEANIRESFYEHNDSRIARENLILTKMSKYVSLI